MYGYIYLTTNLYDNCKQYIGLHKYDKQQLDESYFGSGKILKDWISFFRKNNIKLKDVLKVDILEFCDTLEELNKAEIKWINYYNAIDNDNFYNIARGGMNNPVHKLSDYEKSIRSKNLSERNKKNWQNSEYRAKITKILIQNGYNTHHSEETRRKMSEMRKGMLKGHKMSDEARRKMSEAKKLRPSPTMTSEGNPMRNRKWMYNDVEIITVKPDEVEYYLSLGYQFGRVLIPRKWINNGINSKCIKVDDLDEYLSNGWQIGRLL